MNPGIFVALFSHANRRPAGISTATEKRHVAGVEAIVGSTLPSLGEVPEVDLERSDVLELLQLPSNHRERLVQANEIPLRLMQTLLREPTYLRQVTPRKFEEIVADILLTLGFNDVLLTASSNDGGRDIIASQLIHGIPITFYFECKRYSEKNTVDIQTLRALLGTVSHNKDVNKAVLVTTTTFEPGAKKLIAAEARLDGKEYDDVIGWMHAAWGPKVGAGEK